jgi:hypothetical protein
VGRALDRLGIEHIAAYSPEARGRSERMFGTLQDRLIKELAKAVLTEALCIQEDRVVDRVNTVSWGRLRLQLPQSPLRAHFVKARVRVHEYPDGALAVFHGPRCIARYNARGEEISAVPTCASVTPCSPPSRRGLSRTELVESAARRPSLTAAARGVTGPMQVGTWRNRGTGIVLVPRNANGARPCPRAVSMSASMYR